MTDAFSKLINDAVQKLGESLGFETCKLECYIVFEPRVNLVIRKTKVYPLTHYRLTKPLAEYSLDELEHIVRDKLEAYNALFTIHPKSAKVLAVDFDGCLCKNAWPKIGEPNERVIAAVKQRKAEGWKVILWTCREDKLLADALAWCGRQGLGFDAVNENLPERIEQYGRDPRKIGADEYWDDLAVTMHEDVFTRTAERGK